MEGTMKQLIFVTKGELELREVDIPQIDENGILIKVAYAGICGSDIHGFTKGGRYGGIGDGCKFGHEFAGVIVEVGAAVTDFKVGDRVWADPTYCVADPRFCCMAGGFAEYVAVLKVEKDVSVFTIPEDVPLRSAALIEPFGVGVHTKNRGGACPDDNILMIGAGPIGLMGWAAMKHAGCENVLVAERMQTRIDFAKKLGVDVFDNSEVDSYEYAGEKFGMATISSYTRPDIDLVVDYVGIGSLLGEYLEKGRSNSRFATLGLDRTPLTIEPGELMSKQFSIFGSRAYDPADIAEVIETLQDKNVDIASIITGEYTLEEYEAAFAAAIDRNTGMKVIFRIAGE